MHIGITILQHIVYRQSSPIWVDDMDPVWIITVAPFRSYNVMFRLYITVSYSDRHTIYVHDTVNTSTVDVYEIYL